MADTPISLIASAAAALTSHRYVVQEGSANKAVSGTQLSALIGSLLGQTGFVEKSADQAGIVSTSFTDITGMGIPVAAGKRYSGRFVFMVDAGATSEGIRITLSGPATPTRVSWLLTRSTSATIVALDAFSAYDVDPGDTGSAGPAQRLTVLEWVLQNGGTAGTVIPRVRAETGAQAVNIRAGSYGTYREAG